MRKKTLSERADLKVEIKSSTMECRLLIVHILIRDCKEGVILMLKEVQFYRRLSISTVLAVVLLTLLAPVAAGAAGATVVTGASHSLKAFSTSGQLGLATALVGPATSYL